MKRFLLSLAAASLVLAAGSGARAQDGESSPDIELGSSRIGGPGLTKRERRRVKSWDEPEEYLTEETLPKPGDKKRLPALHTLAGRYVTTKQWEEACNKYDTIEGEFGTEGVIEAPDGKKNAARAYFYCGRRAANHNEEDKAEKLLEKSERYGPSTAKHAMVRENMLREQYRKKLGNGDVDGAIALFDKAQKMREVEDERIWLGEELAKRAKDAMDAGDELQLETLMSRLSEIAPMNTEYRRMKDEIEMRDSILSNALTFAGAIVGFVLVMGLFMRWLSARRVKKFGGNPFEDL